MEAYFSIIDIINNHCHILEQILSINKLTNNYVKTVAYYYKSE